MVSCALIEYAWFESSGSSKDEIEQRYFMMMLKSGIEKSVRLENKIALRRDCTKEGLH
jgi:hypothetical protein